MNINTHKTIITILEENVLESGRLGEEVPLQDAHSFLHRVKLLAFAANRTSFKINVW